MPKLAGGCLGALLTIVLLAAPARAELPPEVSIDWSGDCPRPFALDAEVARLLGTDRPQLEQTEIEVDVDLKRGGKYQLELEVESSSVDAERRVMLSSCREAQDAAVLLIATAIDPDAVLRVSKPAPARPAAQRAPVPSVRRAARWSLRAGPVLDTHALPAVSGGPFAGVLYQGEHLRAWLDVHYLAARTARAEELSARVELFTASLGGGYGWQLGPLRVGPQLALALGALRARDIAGPSTLAANDAAGAWASVALGGFAAYGVTERVGVELAMSAGVPLRRPELALRDGEPFYATRPATMQLALAVRVTLGSP